MELHWHHPELFREQDRIQADQRIRSLASDHSDVIDVRISARPSTHHRRSGHEVRITCEARGQQLVAARTGTDPGVALNESLDAFEREIWRMRHRRTQRRRARSDTPRS
jgi:ribosome-associated translation inhibitor RaiA